MNYDLLDDALGVIREALDTGETWSGGMILGSGWGEVIADAKEEGELSFAEVPGLGSAGVAGHAGRVVALRLGTRRLLVFQGRRHGYEGEGWTPIALPVYILAKLGAPVVLLTNAAGGIRPDLGPGRLMALTDHINMMHDNPLRGPHHPVWGARFPDMSEVYNADLRRTLLAAGEQTGSPLAEGVYLAAAGPVYETPAEIRAYRALGADAVGMSTVPEAMLAQAAGLRVAAISCISNAAAGLGTGALSHEEVTTTTQDAMPAMRAVVETFWAAV